MNTDTSSNTPKKIIAIAGIILLVIVFITGLYLLLTPEEPHRVETTQPTPIIEVPHPEVTPTELPHTGYGL